MGRLPVTFPLRPAPRGAFRERLCLRHSGPQRLRCEFSRHEGLSIRCGLFEERRSEANRDYSTAICSFRLGGETVFHRRRRRIQGRRESLPLEFVLPKVQ